jgi:hypothetical protein
VSPSGNGARRAAAGLVVGAAGMLVSRLRGRRGAAETPEPEHSRPEVELQPGEREPTSEELERARSELSEALARRSAGDS